eukprot:97556-Prymnesium_polylepis.2
MSVGGVVSGIFGMNLQSPIFSAGDDGWIFLTVVCAIAVGIVAVILSFWLMVLYGGSIRHGRRAADPLNRGTSTRDGTSSTSWPHARITPLSTLFKGDAMQ